MSTQLIKPNYLVILPPTQHHSFFRNLPPLFIYTNVLHKVIKAGICLADVSDHLPIFCTVANKPSILNDAKYFHDFSHFDSDSFLSDVEAIDFCGLVNEDVNQSINDLVQLVDILQRIPDKHAPAKRG